MAKSRPSAALVSLLLMGPACAVAHEVDPIMDRVSPPSHTPEAKPRPQESGPKPQESEPKPQESEPKPQESEPKPPPEGPCDFAIEPHADLTLPAWDLLIDDDAWDALHEDVEADVEVDASVCVEGRLYPIELELQGASTRRLAKKSFDIKLNRGERLTSAPYYDGDGAPSDGIGKILMKAMFQDHSLIREAIAFDLFREMGGQAPRIGFANLRINGEYWGLYVLVEPIDEDYLLRHGYPAGGRLYKATRKHGSYADFKPGRSVDRAFEAKELDDWDESPDQDEEHDRADIERLVEALQATELTDEAFAAEIDPIFPLDSYFERMIWVSWTQNGDGTAQNFYLYNTPSEGADYWHQLPWDSNLCFSAYWRDPDAILSPAKNLLLDGRNYFGQRLVRVPGLRERYIARFREVIDDVLTPDVVYERFAYYSALVEHDLAVDQARWERNVDPSAAFDVLVDFFEARPDALREGLAELEAAEQD